MRNEPLNLLYVEDDSSDIDLARIALQDIGCPWIQISTVADGEEALDYLNRRGTYQDAKRPDLVLLDLNLPKIHGREILRAIKDDRTLKRIPVIVMSTSRQQNDIDECYFLGASGYFAKPDNYQEYKETFRVFCDYWGRNNVLPK